MTLQLTGKERSKIEWLDWMLFAAAGAAAFLLFCHKDILITANHSYVYLNGHFRSFYSFCQKMNGSYSANYMPTTFLLFAVWNIPLKLLGLGPQYWGDWNLAFTLWNKLLPALFYLGSIRLIICMGRECFGFPAQKARLAALIFAMSPLAFYSQFLFCQYDAITVFFMLLGMYFYFQKEKCRKNTVLFALSFAVAATLKYHSILIFLVLLFLREKKISKILTCAAGCLSLYGAEFLLYYVYDRTAFQKAVLGFKVLDYSSANGIKIGGSVIELVPFVLCLVLAWAYFTECRDRDEEIRYAFFFCNGVFFALFALMYWHPQWILLAVPFWSISICLNRKNQILLWVELILSTVFILYVVVVFKNNGDQNLLRYGVLSSALQYSVNPSVTMKQILGDPDRSLCFTVMAAIFLIYFLFSHPKYSMKKLSDPLENAAPLIGARFLWGVLLFAVPAFLCLPSMLQSPERLWRQRDYQNEQTAAVGEEGAIVQYATIPGDSITRVSVYTVIGSGEKGTQADEAIVLTITDPETGEELARSRLDPKKIKTDGYTKFTVEDCQVEAGKQYAFSFSSESGAACNVSIKYGGYPSNYQIPSIDTVQKDYDEDYVQIDGQILEQTHAVSQILGHYRK